MEKTFHKHIAHGHFSQGPSWLKNIKMKRIHTQKQLRTGALNTLILLIALAWSAALHGEGTRQVAPTGPGDIVMLETNSPDFGNFATFNGPEDSRLYITINDPGEVVYLGLSAEFSDLGSPFGLLSYSQYRFRIKKVVQGGPDPIVHGPFTISNTNANVNSWNQAQYGSYSVTATNSAGQLIYQFAPGSAGDYYIEFADFTSDNDPKVMIGYWDITVTSGGNPVNGRVWSRNWAFRTPRVAGNIYPECGWDRPFNGTLYSYTTDGFVSKIDFQNSGFQGLSFNVAFTSQGPGATGDLTERRKSVYNANATGAAAEHKIFLSEPDPVVFPNGECGEITAASTFHCTGDGNFCLDVSVTKPGQVEIYLDFNRNGIFDPNSQDVSLVYNFGSNEIAACIPWDGLRGDSTAVAFGDTVNLLFYYSQGVQHWAVYDGEFLKNGFCVEAVRPTCGSLTTDILYWDDRNIVEDPGTGQPKDGRGGCPCGSGCRTWTNFDSNPGMNDCSNIQDENTTGYGDKSTLNTWWYANIVFEQKVNIPLLSCMIVTADDSICAGETTVFEAIVSGTSTQYTYSWSGPAGFTSNQASTGPIGIPGEYCVTITDVHGCTSTCCRDLIQNGTLVVTAASTNATCEASTDGTVTAMASGGVGDYSYSLDNGPFQPDPVFTGVSAGTHTLTVMDDQGCPAVIEVIVEADLVIDIAYPDTILVCSGESAQITPVGSTIGLFFSWDPVAGLSDPNAADPVVTPSGPTLYTVTIGLENVPACQVEQQVFVNVTPPINLEVSGDLTTCQDSTTLIATASAGVGFAWYDGDGNLISDQAEITFPVSGSADYSVIASDTLGCQDTVLLTVSGGPVDVVVPDTAAVCLGEQIDLTVINQDPNDTLTYLWTPAGLFAGGTDTASPDYIETVGYNTVYVTITNQFGCMYEDSVHVAVIDPAISLSFTSEVQCDGTTVKFTNTSTDAFGYLWLFGDGTTSTATNPVHLYPGPGTYTVTLTTVYDVDCVVPATATIVVEAPELIADFTYDIVACAQTGATIAFFDQTFNSSGSDLTWMWTFSNGTTSGEQNPMVDFAGSGELIATLVVNASNGCVSEVSDTLDIQLVDVSLADTIIVCLGDSAELNPDGNPDLTYEWTPATGLDDPNSANPTVTPASTTIYSVTIQNIAGSDTCTITEQITVFVPDPINLNIGPDIVTCGEDVTLTASADVPVTVQWISTNEGGPIGNGPVIEFNPFGTDTIIAKATDGFGCMAFDTLILINNGVDAELDPAGPIMACEGFETEFSVTNLDPNDVLSYQWSPAEFIVGSTTDSAATYVITEGNITVQVIVSNQFGCNDTLTAQLSVVPFDPNLPDTVMVCPGTQPEINPEFTPGYTYQWSPPEGLSDPNAPNPVFTGTEDMLYYVTVTNTVQGFTCEVTDSVWVLFYPEIGLETTGDTVLCEAVPVVLTAATDVPAQIDWYTDFNGTPFDSGSPITVTPENGQNIYMAIATDTLTGCQDTSMVTILVNSINGIPDTMITVCANTPTELNPGGNPGLEYVWTPDTNLDLTEPWNPVITTDSMQTFHVVITDPGSGCMLTRDIKVNVYPLININAGEDIVQCAQNPVTLEAAADVDLESVIWLENGTQVGTGLIITPTPPLGIVEYVVIGTDFNGCMDSDTVMVSTVPVQATITAPLVICEETDAVELMVTNLDPTQELTIEWSPANAVEPATGPIVTVNPNLATDFTAIVTNQYGCSDTLSTSVTLITLNLDLTISAEPDTIRLGESTTITVGGCPTCDFDWTVPSGGITPDTGPIVVATPEEAGSQVYEVAVGMLGCVEELSIEIVVLPFVCDEDHVFLPNTFTPNGDGVNDVVRLRSLFLEDYLDFELMIYNRWGQEIFRTTDPFAIWDGTFKGERLPPDVYGYWLKVRCPDEEELIQKGNITLIR